MRLRDLATAWVRNGYRRLHVLLCREDCAVDGSLLLKNKSGGRFPGRRFR